MSHKTVCLACVLFALIVLPLQTRAETGVASGADSTVAKIDGLVILRSDVDASLGNVLLPLQTAVYDRWRTGLDEYVDAILLSRRARERGMRIDELIRNEVNGRVEPATKSEALAVIESAPHVYQSMSSEAALAAATADLWRRRVGRRRTDFMAELRSLYHYEVSAMPPRLRHCINGGQSTGQENAKVSIVVFTDFQCPYCATMSTVLDRVLHDYPTDVRIIFKHFPLPNHTQAARAAEAALCAGEQDRFWEMQKLLFLEQNLLSSDKFAEVADRAGLDVPAFRTCFDSRRHMRDWQADQTDGQAIGVTSTPTVFINGRMILGARPYDAFLQVVNEEIRLSSSGYSEKP